MNLPELKPCPFCGNFPWFEGSPSEWKDDSRYVEMHVVCCVTMSEAIGWRRAREMQIKEREEELKEKLTEKWNKRE